MLDDATKFADILSKVVGVAVIVFGAGWGYIKFVRYRTFQERATVTVSVNVIDLNGTCCLQVRVACANTGSTHISLDRNLTIVNLRYLGADEVKGRALFSDTRYDSYWLSWGDRGAEPGDTLVDELLLPIPGGGNSPAVVFKVTAQVTSTTRTKAGQRAWFASVVVPAHGHGVGAVFTSVASSTGKDAHATVVQPAATEALDPVAAAADRGAEIGVIEGAKRQLTPRARRRRVE